jgi:hypothetical protein
VRAGSAYSLVSSLAIPAASPPWSYWKSN